MIQLNFKVFVELVEGIVGNGKLNLLGLEIVRAPGQCAGGAAGKIKVGCEALDDARIDGCGRGVVGAGLKRKFVVALIGAGDLASIEEEIVDAEVDGGTGPVGAGAADVNRDGCVDPRPGAVHVAGDAVVRLLEVEQGVRIFKTEHKVGHGDAVSGGEDGWVCGQHLHLGNSFW